MADSTVEKILVVEDNDRLRESLTRVLEPVAGEVRAVSCLQHAESEMRSWRPDLVFLDFKLPDGDACEFLRRIDGQIPLPPVIGMSAVAQPADSFELGQLGVRAFVQKPLDQDRIRVAIRKVFQPADVSAHLRGTVGAVGLQDLEEQVRLAMVEQALLRAGSVRGAARLLRVSRQFLQHAVRKIRDRVAETPSCLDQSK